MRRKTDRKVSCFMKPYIEEVFIRDEIAYEFIPYENGFMCRTELSKSGFTEALEDAFCEIQKEESCSNIPVYSLRTQILRSGQHCAPECKICGSR